MSSLPKVLFTSPIIQYPPHGGPALRIANSIKALSFVSELSIIYANEDSREFKATFEFLNRHSQQVFCPFAEDRLPRSIRRILNRFGIRKSNETTSQNSNERIARLILRNKFDAVWLGYGNISYSLLKRIKQESDVPVVLDTDSVWSRYVLRGLPFAKDDFERAKIEKEGSEKEIEEAWGTELANVTTAVSEIDAEYYRGLIENRSRVKLFSNVIDLHDYREISPPPNDHVAKNVFLAGTFWAGSPMEHAARWMINEVLPVVRVSHPDLHFYIVGKDSNTVLADVRDPNITITGRVDSVLPYLRHTRAALVPLWFESGTRFKILEAGACGIPVVSTTLGAEGIPVSDGQNILIGDTPATFAQAIVRLVEQPGFAKSIASSLCELVATSYSLDKLKEEAESILRYLKLNRTGVSSGRREQS